jgi:hypothetical protein
MKLTKRETHYSLGKGSTVCGKCTHWIGVGLKTKGACEIVAGVIRRDYWCDRFDRATVGHEHARKDRGPHAI